MTAPAVAIVTGGGGGLGRALCRALAERGSTVVVADLDQGAAVRVAEEIGAEAAASAALDVTNADAVRALVHSTVDRHGRLDLMINNAGVGIWGDARDLELEQWRRVLDVNYWGAVHGSLAAYEVMAEQRSGQILNVASLAGLVSAPSVTPYAAAKHAVVGLSTSLRAEAARHGVRVNVACPGPIRSGFHEALLRAADSDRVLKAPADALEPDRAAERILRAAARNQRVIVVPRGAWWLWMSSRLFSWWVERINRRTVRGLAAARGEDSAGNRSS